MNLKQILVEGPTGVPYTEKTFKQTMNSVLTKEGLGSERGALLTTKNGIFVEVRPCYEDGKANVKVWAFNPDKPNSDYLGRWKHQKSFNNIKEAYAFAQLHVEQNILEAKEEAGKLAPKAKKALALWKKEYKEAETPIKKKGGKTSWGRSYFYKTSIQKQISDGFKQEFDDINKYYFKGSGFKVVPDGSPWDDFKSWPKTSYYWVPFKIVSENGISEVKKNPSKGTWNMKGNGYSVVAYVSQNNDGEMKSSSMMLTPGEGATEFNIWNDEKSSQKGEFWWDKNDIQRGIRNLNAKKPNFVETKAMTSDMNKLVKIIGSAFNAYKVDAVKKSKVSEGTARKEMDPINKQPLKNMIYKKITKITKGIYKDQYWNGVNKIWDVFNDLGLDWNIQKAEYDHKNSPPTYKIWYIEINFTNKAGKPQKIFGNVTAAGAGTVKDPLDAYDVNLVMG